MPSLNKQTENKASIFNMQLVTEQLVFVGYLEVKEVFRRRFPEKDSPTNKTILKNVKKYKKEGTSLNINKGRSGRRRTVRTKEAIEVFRLYVKDNARNVSCRRNGLELNRSTFNKIMKQDLDRDT